MLIARFLRQRSVFQNQSTDSFQNKTLTGGVRIETIAIAITTANATLSQACLPTPPSPLVLDTAGGGDPAVGPPTDVSAVDEPACQPKLAVPFKYEQWQITLLLFKVV